MTSTPLSIPQPEVSLMGHRIHWSCTVEGCGSSHEARGLCNRHYIAFRKKHGKLPKQQPTPARDFLYGFVLTYAGADCLLWPFARNSQGYAQVSVPGRGVTYATRVICEEIYGPPLPGMVAAHSCANGHLGCVNPTHLRWATHQENVDDTLLHGTRLRGEKVWNAKLTEQDAREIIRLRGQITQTELAKRFGVAPSLIANIQLGKSWAHIGGRDVVQTG